MLESRWVRRVGPGLAAIGAIAVIATSALGARDPAWDPPPCAGTGAAPGAPAAAGTWWRMDPILANGTLVGQRLALGGPGLGRPRILDLPAESFAAGPVGGQVLVGSDDGRRSDLALLDVARGCRRSVASSSDVIRTGTLTPDLAAVLEFRLDRSTRRELGVFRRPLSGVGPTMRLLGPIRSDARFGTTWTTAFTWSQEGRHVAVESCGAIACRTRVVDLADGAVREIADPSHGDAVGLADGHLVLHEACGGLPCPLVSVDLDDGRRVVLHESAGQATVAVGPDGAPVVIHEIGVDGGPLRSVGLDGRGAAQLPADAKGRRLIAGPGRSAGGVELGTGLILLGPGGRLPLDGPLPLMVRRLADGASLELAEVSR